MIAQIFGKTFGIIFERLRCRDSIEPLSAFHSTARRRSFLAGPQAWKGIPVSMGDVTNASSRHVICL
jgi:hypothetical protein